MRLVQVAKVLGMTGQELRRELSQVNFGVKPTDREVPDTLARGLLRFLAQKKGLQIDVDAAVGAMAAEPDDGSDESVAEVREPPLQGVKPDAGPISVESHSTPVAPQNVNVLRKLTLEDVPKAAIQRAQRELNAAAKPARGGGHRQEFAKRERPSEQRDQQQIKRKDGPVSLPDTITVKELAEKTGIQVPQIIASLLKNGVMATINQSIDFDTAAVIATDLGVTVEREQRSATAEQLFNRNLEDLLRDEPERMKPRPPIVVVMGHVDHGKTALLDAIRKTDVVSQEAGGITQHIGASPVEYDSPLLGRRMIMFLDTPGHEAFTAMRARGAQVTDIVILVVSAEEGVKPTTIEAINHAKDADVPIVVAITKVDKERADIERVKGELAAQGLQPDEWGGKVPMVPCSAVSKQGIPDLLDHVLLIADERGLKANPDRPAVATVIESHLDISLGSLATVIINTGTLTVGDMCVCGTAVGRAKALIDAHGKRVQTAGPSLPVQMAGLDEVPTVGDILQVTTNEQEARALQRKVLEQEGRQVKRSFADLVTRLTEGKLKNLKVVLKTDTQGSLEAIREALSKLTSTEQNVSVKVIHGAIGSVTESDVMMAAASDGLVLAFHTPVSADVMRTADREGVRVQSYDILYELLDEVEKLLQGLIEPEEVEKILGHLEVKAVFFTKHSEQIVGGRVTDGIIKRVQFRLMRSDAQIGTGRITSMKHVDKDIKEAKEGQECGMRIEASIPVEVEDVLEVYHRELKRKES